LKNFKVGRVAALDEIIEREIQISRR